MINLLFRPEVVAAKRRRLFGEVRVAQPVGLATWVVLISVVALAFFIGLLVVELPSKEAVQGRLLPEAGLIEVVAPDAAVVGQIYVSEGVLVPRGKPLFELGSDAGTTRLGPYWEAQARELQNQQASIRERQVALRIAGEADIKALEQQSRQAEQLIESLESEISLQRSAVDLAKVDVGRFEDLRTRGYATFADSDRRRRTVLAEQSALRALERQLVEQQTAFRNVRTDLSAAPARLEAQAAELAALTADLAMRTNEADLARQRVVHAPVAGQITSIRAKAGQSVGPGYSIVTLAPANSPLEAVLEVPSRAAGFIQPGQQVRLQLSAYPYQRYGFLTGRIRSVAGSLVAPDPRAGVAADSVVEVRVSLPEPWIVADGQQRSLAPGMTLDADIVLQKRKLWELLFGPLIGTARRMSTP